MKPRRPISEEEKNLWDEVTQGIKPIHKDRVIAPPSHNRPSRQKIIQRRLQELYQSVGETKGGLPHGESKLIRSRKLVVDGRIDLHGLTQEQAHENLRRFLIHAQLEGKEWVLVITGKGSVHQASILRQEVPRWLDQWSFVTAYMVAKPNDGGTGAFYVRVRRQKT
jgi:DNA-nicking Smr family endonuclease